MGLLASLNSWFTTQVSVCPRAQLDLTDDNPTSWQQLYLWLKSGKTTPTFSNCSIVDQLRPTGLSDEIIQMQIKTHYEIHVMKSFRSTWLFRAMAMIWSTNPKDIFIFLLKTISQRPSTSTSAKDKKKIMNIFWWLSKYVTGDGRVEGWRNTFSATPDCVSHDPTYYRSLTQTSCCGSIHRYSTTCKEI